MLKKERLFKNNRAIRKFFKELKKREQQSMTFEQWASKYGVPVNLMLIAKKQSLFRNTRFGASLSTAVVIVTMAIVLPFVIPGLIGKPNLPLAPTDPAGPSTPVVPPPVIPPKQQIVFSDSAVKILIDKTDLYEEYLFIFDLVAFDDHETDVHIEFFNEAEDDDIYDEGNSLILAYTLTKLSIEIDTDALLGYGSWMDMFDVSLRMRVYEKYEFEGFVDYHDLGSLEKGNDIEVNVYYYILTYQPGGGIAFISFSYQGTEYFLEVKSDFWGLDEDEDRTVLEALLDELLGDLAFELTHETETLMRPQGEGAYNDN